MQNDFVCVYVCVCVCAFIFWSLFTLHFLLLVCSGVRLFSFFFFSSQVLLKKKRRREKERWSCLLCCDCTKFWLNHHYWWNCRTQKSAAGEPVFVFHRSDSFVFSLTLPGLFLATLLSTNNKTMPYSSFSVCLCFFTEILEEASGSGIIGLSEALCKLFGVALLLCSGN